MMSAELYRRAVAIRFMVYIVILAVFQPLLFTAFTAGGCHQQGCGLFAMMIGGAGKLVIAGVFALSFVSITTQRISDLYLPKYLAYIIPLLLLSESAQIFKSSMSLMGGTSATPIAFVWIIFLSIISSEDVSRIMQTKAIKFFKATIAGVIFCIAYKFLSAILAHTINGWMKIIENILLVMSFYCCFILTSQGNKTI